ncbi:retinoic acid receptor responder 2 [Willisornis vidua]|uniref:Retinoic acid receptor responder 2 n=1 Tax=Willisornis vidua TaxID=1566151 RepID=A0ABQ9D4G8_9PASS|nr:retinoic acid receptor responder 2 [Willisornis vidua]
MRLPVSLWLPLALAVAAVAAGQSPLQRRVVRDVLEYFHGRSNVHFLFRERELDGAIERWPREREEVGEVVGMPWKEQEVFGVSRREQLVENVIEWEDPSGTFVQLRLGLAQTSCRKRGPQRQCRLMENRRKPTCLACYKFDTSDVPEVLDKYHNCGPAHHLAAKEIRQRDEAECRAVEEAGKGPYLPGMFAFSRGLPA